jgi:hypothetical protein
VVAAVSGAPAPAAAKGKPVSKAKAPAKGGRK